MRHTRIQRRGLYREHWLSLLVSGSDYVGYVWYAVNMLRKYNYTAVFEPAEEGGFVVTFPALPGLVTEGDTLEEARMMAADALHGYLESLAKDGIAAPAEDARPSMRLIRESVAVAV